MFPSSCRPTTAKVWSRKKSQYDVSHFWVLAFDNTTIALLPVRKGSICSSTDFDGSSGKISHASATPSHVDEKVFKPASFSLVLPLKSIFHLHPGALGI